MKKRHRPEQIVTPLGRTSWTCCLSSLMNGWRSRTTESRYSRIMPTTIFSAISSGLPESMASCLAWAFPLLTVSAVLGKVEMVG